MQQYNQRIANWLGAYRDAIQAGDVRVFAVDECHLKGGDICGYGWGNRQERREVEVANYRASQTYFGAVDCISGELLISAADTANGDSTIEFIERLRAVSQGARIVIVWDGASYHRSQQLRDFLALLNQGEDWQIHCLRFAPYAPQETRLKTCGGKPSIGSDRCISNVVPSHLHAGCLNSYSSINCSLFPISKPIY